MAKLQFLRVGWGGVGMMTFFELEHMLAGCYATVFVLSLHTCWLLRNCVCLVIAHMLDATQLCLSCHCTHAGCYATVFVLSLHTCWMLRNCVCLVIAHMLDATQLRLSCHCTHAGCYATVFVLSLHTCWMLRNCVCLVIAHMLDATQLCLSCHCTHAGCYATAFVLSLHACWMMQLCFLVIAHMLDATQLCLSCHCTPDVTTIVWRNMFGRFCSERTRDRTCLKHWANWPMSRQCQKMVKKRRLFFGGWFQYARIPSKTPLWRHEPMEKMGRNEHMNQQTINGNQHPCSISCIFNKITCEYRPGSQSRP